MIDAPDGGIVKRTSVLGLRSKVCKPSRDLTDGASRSHCTLRSPVSRCSCSEPRMPPDSKEGSSWASMTASSCRRSPIYPVRPRRFASSVRRRRRTRRAVRRMQSCAALACRFTASALAARLLNGGTRRRAERTEHAAIAGLWAQQRPAAGAFVKELACVGRHGFELRRAAFRTSDKGLFDCEAAAHARLNSRLASGIRHLSAPRRAQTHW